jgi:hypothetical protein
VYTIHPRGLDHPTEVWCQFEDDGAWNVIQRRHIKSTGEEEDFQRSWEEYRHGFGSRRGDHWLGNDALHSLTSQGDYSLLVRVWDVEGTLHVARYRQVTVENEGQSYRLHVSGYHGNASDGLRHHDGAPFSTWDVDNDSSSSQCAVQYRGGWWYRDCQHVNLNGKQGLGMTWFDSNTNQWLHLNNVQMSIRRNNPATVV